MTTVLEEIAYHARRGELAIVEDLLSMAVWLSPQGDDIVRGRARADRESGRTPRAPDGPDVVAELRAKGLGYVHHGGDYRPPRVTANPKEHGR